MADATETVNSAETFEAWWPRRHSAASLRLQAIHRKVGQADMVEIDRLLEAQDE